MGSAFKPGQVRTPRNDVQDFFSGLVGRGMSGANVGGQMAGGFQLPGYSGPFTPNETPLQQQGANAMGQALSGFDPAQGNKILTAFASMFNRQGMNSGDIAQRVNNVPGSDTLGSAANGGLQLQDVLQGLGMSTPGGFDQATSTLMNNPAISRLLSLGSGGSTSSANPALASLLGFQASMPGLDLLQMFNPNIGERGGLNAASGQNVIGAAMSPLNDAQAMLRGFSSLPAVDALLSGGGGDIGSIYQALDAQRRQALGGDVRDIREQFSNAGLRSSTDLAGAIGQRQAASESGMNATLAQLVPSLLSSQTQSRSAGLNFLAQIPQLLTQVGSTTGGLNLGQQQNTISGLGTAGNLGLGASGQSLDAMRSALSSVLQGQGLNLDALKAAAGTATADTGVNMQAMVQALTSAGQLSQGGASSMIDALLSNRGQQSGILQQLLGTQVNAAGQAGSQSLQGTDILSQFASGENNQSLQALLNSPNALQTITSLLPGLASGAFGMGQQQYGNASAGIDRQIADFQFQQSLLPMIIQYMSGTPAPTVTPSPFQTAMGAVGDIGGLLTGQALLKKAK